MRLTYAATLFCFTSRSLMRAHSRKRPALITFTLMVAYESFVCIMPCLDYSGLRIMSTDMKITPALCQFNRVFSLAWPASMQISWNKRKRLQKRRVQLPEDWFGTPTWSPFHCFGTQIWPPWRHVKTLYKIFTSVAIVLESENNSYTSKLHL